MPYDHRSPTNVRRASDLLNNIPDPLIDGDGGTGVFLPDDELNDLFAGAIIDTNGRDLLKVEASPLWLRANVVGAHAYEGDGGWFADLAFDGLPPGTPDVVGEGPFDSRRAALESLRLQLEVCLRHEREALTASEPRSYFKFGECLVPVSPSMAADYAKRYGAAGITEEEVQFRLVLLRGEAGGDDAFTDEAYRESDLELQVEICRAATMAMALGMEGFGPGDANWGYGLPSLRH